MAAKKKSDKKDDGTGRKLIASNRRARHEYAVLDTVEAGVVLNGSEVKSLRLGQVQMADGFARYADGELWLHGVHIAPYQFASGVGAHDPDGRRKLLLHRAEIDRLQDRVAQERLALIPLQPLLQGRAGQDRARPRQGPPEVRQAAGDRRARLEAGDRTRPRSAQQGHVTEHL